MRDRITLDMAREETARQHIKREARLQPARDRRARAKAKVDMHDDLVGIARKYADLIRSDYEGRHGIDPGMRPNYDAALAVIAKAEALK